MNVTVIICTFNRCLALGEALEGVAASVLPNEVEWEVLVVDNNSTDQTRQVLDDFSRRYPGRFRYVFEGTPGKSFALNTGIREARGTILAFMDDDVSIEPTWLWNLTNALHDPQWAGVGGRVLLRWTCPPPKWLAVKGRYNLAGLLAQFDFGEQPCTLVQAPIGANMAVRKSMFEEYGGFRIDLGPSPNLDIPRPNEDTEFGRRLMAAGRRLRYEPTAVAYHGVPADRLRKNYFTSWWFDYGRAAVREVGVGSKFWGLPRCCARIPKIIVSMSLPRALRWMFAVHPQQRCFWKCFLWNSFGQIVENYRLSFREGNSSAAIIQSPYAVIDGGAPERKGSKSGGASPAEDFGR